METVYYFKLFANMSVSIAVGFFQLYITTCGKACFIRYFDNKDSLM